MYVLGLTGSIGMGKSAVAARFRLNGVPVFDADRAVHDLYAGVAVGPIEREFPGTTNDGVVDRDKLSQALLAAPKKFARLEAIVHPLVRALEADFLVDHAARGTPLVVLEVPLLYETGFDALLDGVAVVSAPANVQADRVLARPGMTPQKLAQLLARQLPDAEKRRRADYIVDTGSALAETEAQVDRLTESLRKLPGKAYARHWQ
jgi:dephospho-CoA kinase